MGTSNTLAGGGPFTNVSNTVRPNESEEVEERGSSKRKTSLLKFSTDTPTSLYTPICVFCNVVEAFITSATIIILCLQTYIVSPDVYTLLLKLPHAVIFGVSDPVPGSDFHWILYTLNRTVCIGSIKKLYT